MVIFRFFEKNWKWHELLIGKLILKLNIHMRKIMRIKLYIGDSNEKKRHFLWKKHDFRKTIYKWWLSKLSETIFFVHIKWRKFIENVVFETNVYSNMYLSFHELKIQKPMRIKLHIGDPNEKKIIFYKKRWFSKNDL